MPIPTRLLVVLLLALVAPAVRAHDVPIPPSTCAFDPIEITVPGVGRRITAAAAGPADALRIVYLTGSKTAQFNAGTVPPRDLAGAGTGGALALPAVFTAHLLGSGDFTAPGVALGLTIDGTAITLPVTLTTGLTSAGGVLAEGAPMNTGGIFTLAGVAPLDGMPAPLGGEAAVVRLTCTAAPVPDLDQFPVIATKRLAGMIATRGLRLRAVIDPGLQPADFPGQPAVVRVTVGTVAVATIDFPAGLETDGPRAFVGQSANGLKRVTVRLVRRVPATYTLMLGVRGAFPDLPPGRSLVTVSYQVGGLLSRAERFFHGNRAGTKLEAR